MTSSFFNSRLPDTSFRIPCFTWDISQPMLSSTPASPAPSTSAVERVPSGDGTALLDNPIFNALLTSHSSLAIPHGQARRYPAEIGPLSGVPDQSAESYRDLRVLAGSGGIVGLFFDEPPSPPPGWTLLRGGLLDQMISTEAARRAPGLLPLKAEMRPLTAADAPLMLDLATLTEPGPFHLRTIELGAFFGIFHGCQLVAMAGQRLSLPGFVEVSAVCTHPDARGRGYAAALMTTVMEDIRARGKTPILHSFTSNASAISVYRSLGFKLRRNFHLAVLQCDL
jgi:GNAT superfamily N-acetyltransferase